MWGLRVSSFFLPAVTVRAIGSLLPTEFCLDLIAILRQDSLYRSLTSRTPCLIPGLYIMAIGETLEHKKKTVATCPGPPAIFSTCSIPPTTSPVDGWLAPASEQAAENQTERRRESAQRQRVSSTTQLRHRRIEVRDADDSGARILVRFHGPPHGWLGVSDKLATVGSCCTATIRLSVPFRLFLIRDRWIVRGQFQFDDGYVKSAPSVLDPRALAAQRFWI
jgi:hypothetical protein